MRTLAAELVVVLVCAGCAAEPMDDCSVAIDPFALVDVPSLVVVKGPAVSLPAPPLRCVPIDRSIFGVRATITGRGGSFVVPTSFAPSLGSPSTVTLEMGTTAPGLYQAEIFVEPSISVMHLTLVVPIDRRDRRPRTSVSPCPRAFQRTRHGTAICESGSTIRTVLLDGGASTFEGRSPLVSGEVVWSERVDGSGVAIERRVEESPGQFRLTHTYGAPEFTAAFEYADETTRWRTRDWATVMPDGGLMFRRTPARGPETTLRLVDGDRPIEISSGGDVCELSTSDCWVEPALKAHEGIGITRDAVWLDFDVLQKTQPALGRPIRRGARSPLLPAGVRLRFAPVLPFSNFVSPMAGAFFEKENMASSATEVMVLRDDGDVELWPFPPGSDVAIVTPWLIELSDQQGGSRLWFRSP